MRPTLFCLSLLLAVTACENSIDTLIGFGGAGGLTQTQAAGNWSFTVHPVGALVCGTGSLADGQILTAHFDVLSAGSLATATSFWQDPQLTRRPISGTIDLSNGSTLLFLGASTGSSAEMELQGTTTAAGSFTGTLRDPRPGSSLVFGSACTYNTTGNKTS